MHVSQRVVAGSDDIHPLLAVQLAGRPGYETLSGEARLALAVIEDAVMTVRLTTGVETPRARRLAGEAWSWIAAKEKKHPYAFENLCDYLGLDAAWLRRGLLLAGHGRDIVSAMPRDGGAGREWRPRRPRRARP